MGITGLLSFLEKATSKVHLKDLVGCSVAVDAYCWLHKGAFGCAEKLVRGQDTDQYINYCLKYVDLMLSYDIKPILVFDGRHLPAKALTEKRRRQSRKESKKLAAELLRSGEVEAAQSHMRRCVDVTHAMALGLIRQCRQRNVDCIVAPYEADAQLAWLFKMKLVQYVVTEDSDLTVFGAQRIIFKLDRNGAGLLVDAEKFHLAMGCSAEKYSFDKFRRMCILSGCDYLDSLRGIGLAKACKFMLMTEEDDMWRALKKIPLYLNLRNMEVDNEYIEQFLQAEATFKHMYIYNPLKRCMERLTALIDSETEERFCCNAGAPLENAELALQLALGNLDPFTMKKLDNWHPDESVGLAQAAPASKGIRRAKHKSIWQANFTPSSWCDQKVGEEKTTNCALLFKKVDLISKSVDEEIADNNRVEQAKPNEAEILSMYQQEVKDLYEPSGKRYCRNYDSDGDNSPPHLPIATASTAHNPFAKLQLATVNLSATVCENNSLLRVLSPKKSSIGAISQRSICFNRLGGGEQRVEVKSRFFVENINQVRKSLSLACKPDITDEIDKIESLSQQQEKARTQLYESPSPKKTVQTLGEGRLSTEVVVNADRNGNPETSVECEKETNVQLLELPLNEDSISSVESAIVLSDEEPYEESINAPSGLLSFSSKPTTAGQKLQFSIFKSQTKRLGLPRPKAKCSSRTIKVNARLVKDKTSAEVKPNQTCLTKYGFQKRPTLKK